MKTILLLLLTLLCLVRVSQTALANDFMVIDLDATDATEFSSQAASWTLSNSICPTCDHSYTTPDVCFSGSTYQVLGGPNVLGLSGKSAKNEYFIKEYPPMETFPVYALLLIDIYLFSDTAGISNTYATLLDITINGKGSSGGSYSAATCTTSSVDSQGVTIANLLRFPNSKFRYDLSSISESQAGKGITLKITNYWNYPTTQRSIGIKNAKLYFFRNASQYSENTNFPCGYNFYWDNNQGCVACHPFCKVCTGTTNNECTSCNSGSFKYPNTTCLATCVVPFKATSSNCNKICTTAAAPYYLNYSATCSATCDSPLISNSDDLCSLPCGTDKYLYPDGSCQSDCPAPMQKGTTLSGYIKTCTVCPNYVYSDGSCKTDCPAPLLIETADDGVKFCYNPCAGTSDFLYPDGSCFGNCDSPLVTVSGVDGQYCKSSCSNADYYLYPDNSCGADCQPPMISENVADIIYCENPCPDGSYLYPDYTCIADCPSPLVSESEASVQYCKSPCLNAGDYIYPDSSCVAVCESPLEIESAGGIPYCKNTCSGYLYPDDSCLGECASPLEAEDVVGISYCKNSCSGYLYPDDSCLADCASSLEIESIGGISYCKNSCNGYLYPDDSCLADCDTPLEIETVARVPYCKSSCNGYLYPDDSCLTGCETPLEIETTAGVAYCKNLCMDYLYPDSTCQTDCASPMIIKDVAGVSYCENPCPNYFYPDGSCLADCESPLTVEDVGDVSYCKNSCSGYWYPDNSCLTDCKSPMTIEDVAGIKYCKSPCPTADDYVYPDGSCDDACSMPLSEKTEDEIKYCYNPCKESNTYLASNQECRVDCPPPSTIKTESIAKYCVFPCEDLDYYYDEGTGECQAACESPNFPVDSPLPRICKTPETTPTPGEDPSSSSTSTELITKVVKATSGGNSALSAGVFAFTILNPLDSTLSLIGSFSKMIQYIKYMKIDYPEKVQIMLKEQSDSFQDFPNKMAPDLLKKFPEHQLPERFMIHNTSSSFFVNFWSTVFKLAVILLVSLVVILIAIHREKKSKSVDGTLKILLDSLKWNLFLTYFCSNIGDGVFYTALELRTLHLGNAAEFISFLLCIAVNVGSLYIMYMILHITWTIRKSKKRVTPLEAENKEPVQNWAHCQTLFAPYQDRWYYQHIYLFLFLVRVGLFNVMLGYLFDYPLLQASVFVLCGILVLTFLIVKRPVKDKISLAMEIIFEVVLLPFNLCVLTLAIMDRQGIDSPDHRNRLGNVLIYINLIAPYLAIAMTATKAFLICVDYYKEYQAEKAKIVKKFSFKAIHPEAVLNATQEVNQNSPDITITKFSPSSSLIDKNLLGNSNSQKIDLDEEPSPSPSPGRSLMAENQRNRLNSLLGKNNKRYRSSLVFPDNTSTSPGLSPTKVSCQSSKSSKSITPPEDKRSNVESSF